MSRMCDLSAKGPMFGHNVSHANNKTKRRFNPNVHWVRLVSHAMRKTVALKLSTQGMKTIDKHGGLDGFLRQTGASKLSGELLRLKREFQKATLEANADLA